MKAVNTPDTPRLGSGVDSISTVRRAVRPCVLSAHRPPGELTLAGRGCNERHYLLKRLLGRAGIGEVYKPRLSVRRAEAFLDDPRTAVLR